jgi:hypothetical protein
MPRIPAVTSEVNPRDRKVSIMSVNEKNLEISLEQDMPIIAAAGEST